MKIIKNIQIFFWLQAFLYGLIIDFVFLSLKKSDFGAYITMCSFHSIEDFIFVSWSSEMRCTTLITYQFSFRFCCFSSHPSLLWSKSSDPIWYLFDLAPHFPSEPPGLSHSDHLPFQCVPGSYDFPWLYPYVPFSNFLSLGSNKSFHIKKFSLLWKRKTSFPNVVNMSSWFLKLF